MILSHIVGFIGFYTPFLQPYFQRLVPFHLLLMAVILILNHTNKDKRFWGFFIGVTITGYLIEVIGVKTGWIFGNYTYGQTLGFKIFDVPLMIGINWALLVYATGYMMKLTPFKTDFLKSLGGACLLVLLDIWLEQVAVVFDYWSWQSNDIPFQNYFGWFVFSFLMLKFFYLFKFDQQQQQGTLAMAIYTLQLLFFIGLNLTVVS